MEIFVSRLVDVILLLVVVEAVCLLVYRGRTGRGLRPTGIVLMLLPGLCLVLALRAGLQGGASVAVLAWLTAALIAHIADLFFRQGWTPERLSKSTVKRY